MRIPDAIPQRLKPPQIRAAHGTTKVVPFPCLLHTQTKRLLSDRRRYRLRGFLLLLPVADGGTDRVLGQH
jgi:hypothetical protein